MKLEWFGRYREITAALIQFSNTMIKSANTEWDIGESVFLTAPEWQVLELVIEHGEENLIMSDYAKLLGIPRSNISKISKILIADELIEKYRFRDNNKTIVLKPTEKGQRIYFNYVDSLIAPLYGTLFEGLSSLDDAALSTVAAALRSFNAVSQNKSSAEVQNNLIKI